jgi:hypothetical protein
LNFISFFPLFLIPYYISPYFILSSFFWPMYSSTFHFLFYCCIM